MCLLWRPSRGQCGLTGLFTCTFLAGDEHPGDYHHPVHVVEMLTGLSPAFSSHIDSTMSTPTTSRHHRTSHKHHITFTSYCSPHLNNISSISNHHIQHVQPERPVAQIGRQLAVIGDDINDRYAPQFNQMIRSLRITPDTAYEAFAGVAKRLFRDGNINWGRIITLLCFGYRMAVTVIQRGIRGFFSNIVGFIVKFIFTEKIAQWIAEQGGWRAALLYVPETVGWPTIGMIFSVAAITVMTAFMLSRRH